MCRCESKGGQSLGGGLALGARPCEGPSAALAKAVLFMLRSVSAEALSGVSAACPQMSADWDAHLMHRSVRA